MNHTDIAGIIKKATTPLHENLEKSAISQKLMSPAAGKDDYAAYLEATYRLHQPVEAGIFPLLTTIVADMPERQKAGHIAGDLAALGLAIPHAEPVDTHGLNINFALGAVYVTEGSTLGGVYIMKTLKEKLGDAIPYSFLNVYGSQAGRRWQFFLQLLNRHAANISASGRDEIVAGAMYSFGRANNIFHNSNVTNGL